MNIKVPNNIKSPTVIIVGGQEPDEKHNHMHEKRMDNLEKKLDQQYKSFIGKTDYIKVIDNMQSSFMANFNKMLAMNKSIISQSHQQRFDSLREEFKNKIKNLEENGDKEEYLKEFASKLTSLENAIKNITLKPQVVKVTNDNKSLLNSFENIFQRIENTIRQSRPRLTPSPS